MKSAVFAAALVGSASAFAPAQVTRSSTALNAAGLAICIAVDPRGAVYALGDKCPPVNQPLSFGKVGDDGTIADPVLGTKFSLKTGEVISWCPAGLGKLIGGLFDP